MVSLSNGIHSEASLGILPLQNGHCPAHQGKLNYKQRRVSAVRDFPPGTGPVASTFRPGTEAGCLRIRENSVNGHASCDFKEDDTAHFSITEAESSVKTLSDSLVRGEIVGVENHRESIDEKLVLPSDHITGCILVSDLVDGSEMKELESAELPMAESVLNEFDDAPKSSKEMHMLESGEDQLLRLSLPKDETGSITDSRKHASKSDFSAKKGENNLAHQQPVPLTGSVSGLDKIVKRRDPRRRKVSAVRGFPPFTGHNAPNLSCEQIKELESAESLMAESVLNESEDEPMEMHMLESEEALLLHMSLPKDETSRITDVSNHTFQSDFSAKNEENNLAHRQPLQSPLTGSVSSLDETVKSSYPPRRKVSAVRDFPSFTGTNAPSLSHERIRELFSAENENLDVEKPVIKRVAAMGHENRRRPDTQDESHEYVKSLNFEKKNAQKKSEKYRCGDDAYGVNNRTGSPRKDMIKKILVNQSRNLREVVSGLPGSTNQSQSEKAVVKPRKVVSRKAETQISRREGREIVLGCPAKSGEFSYLMRGRRKSFSRR